MSVSPRISLIIPVYNESRTIEDLIDTIQDQTLAPDEVILVDGGSTDDTVTRIKNRTSSDPRYKIIQVERAYPGKGRNIGAEAAHNEWIAFTDAGIKLTPTWLQSLADALNSNPSASVVYGNFDPQENGLFQRCATIAYVPAAKPGVIRVRSVVSCLLRKEVWARVDGFPDWRAGEDLVFIERIERVGFEAVYAPLAKAYWQLQPSLFSTFKKFRLYSLHNVWAGRQGDWHYGILRHYLAMTTFLMASFLFHPLLSLFIPGWMIARAVKRGFAHRYEFGLQSYLDPRYVFTVSLITFVIDMATFSGWITALLRPNPLSGTKR